MTYHICEVIHRTTSPLTYRQACATAERAGLSPARCGFQRLDLAGGATWQVLYAVWAIDERKAAYESAKSLAQIIKQKGPRVAGMGQVVVTQSLQPLGGLAHV